MFVPVAIVLKGYPRLSETFIAQEIHALEQRGLDIRLYSMRLPHEPTLHPIHMEITAPVTYLPEYLHRQPYRVFRAWCIARRLPGYRAARSSWFHDLRRDPTRNRIRRFGQALVLAAELPADIGWLHAQFLHTPASVARYAAALRMLPWSASAHAKDIWTTPDWEKREKLADCRWLVTCTRVNAEHLATLAPAAERVELLYHGIDFSRFPPPGERPQGRDGGDPNEPVILLTVARAVAKKGCEVLLEALARQPPGLAWRLVHIGAGPILRTLQRRANALALSPRITWLGGRPQQEVLRAYRAADLFVLACRVAEDGDQDGLPNVLMEAHSQGLACISTSTSAIPELIEDGVTGLLVPPDDPGALAHAIERLIRFPDIRERLGSAGMRKVHGRFSHERGMVRLAELFSLSGSDRPTCESHSMPR